jgi:hypothetical protein
MSRSSVSQAYVGELGFLYHSCQCGGTMIPHSRLFVWVCERRRWWKPWEKHDKIKTLLEVLPLPRS